MSYLTPVFRTSTVVVLFLATVATATAAKEKKHSFRSSRSLGALDHVVVLLEVGGDLTVSENNEVKGRKMSVVGNFSYDEKILHVPADPAGPLRSIRHYEKAEAVIKVDDGGFKPVLDDRRRLIGVKINKSQGVLFSPTGPLTQEELDLIDVLANSLLLDRLLPERPVAVGEHWRLSKELVTVLLGVDALNKSEVDCKLTEVTARAARFEISGQAEGATKGISSEIELKAKFRFDRRTRRIDWVGLLVKEHRDIGHVMQGLDGVARLQIRITPKAASAALAETALEDVVLEPTEALTRLVFRPPGGGWQFTHDRRWNINAAEHDLAIFRFIDRGEFVAQCNVSTLAKVKPGKQQTLETFQRDIQETLGKRFGEFVEAGQWADKNNYRVLRVVVRGLVSELPIHWHYYLVADEHGHQVALAFTVEGKLVERLGEADKELVSTLRFVDPEVTLSKRGAESTEKKTK